MTWKLVTFTSTKGSKDISQWVDETYNNTGLSEAQCFFLLWSAEAEGGWTDRFWFCLVQNKEDQKVWNWLLFCVTLTSSGRDEVYRCQDGFCHSRCSCCQLCRMYNVYTWQILVCSIISGRDWRRKKWILRGGELQKHVELKWRHFFLKKVFCSLATLLLALCCCQLAGWCSHVLSRRSEDLACVGQHTKHSPKPSLWSAAKCHGWIVIRLAKGESCESMCRHDNGGKKGKMEFRRFEQMIDWEKKVE